MATPKPPPSRPSGSAVVSPPPTVSPAHELRAIFEASPECIKLLDRDGRLVDMNASGLAMIEADALAQVKGHQLIGLVAPEDRHAFMTLTDQVFAGMSGTLEFGVTGLKGGRRRLETHAVPLTTSGTVTALLGITRDVTALRRTEQLRGAVYRIGEAVHSTRNLDELYGAIHEIVDELMPAANCLIALYDAPTDTLTFPYYRDESDPPAPPRRGGRGLTELVVRTGQPLHADRAAFDSLIARGVVELIGTPPVDWLGVPLLSNERAFGALVVQSYADGTRYGDTDLELLRFVSDQVAMAIERKRAEQAMRESEASHRALVEHAGLGMYRASGEGRFLLANPALARMLGYANEAEVLDLDVASDVYVRPSDREQVERTIRDHPGTTVDVEWKRRDGRPLAVRLTGQASLEPDGSVAWYDVFAEDIGDRAAHEAQLRQAQRMEAIGRLAGGVAHDFNNLLTAIIGSAELMLQDLEPGHAARPDAVEIKAAALRAAGLTHQLLAFSRRQVMQARPVDLSGIVSGLDPLLRRLIGEHIRLRVDLAPGLPPVMADPGQIEQVVTNLAVNGRDAMVGGGTLLLRTGTADVGAGRGAEHALMKPGTYVTLAVIDSGHGMDAETRAHLFEPFYSTKELGRGTGLGLATVYGIVKQSGGHVFVESEPDRGATFTVYLPASTAPVAPDTVAPEVAAQGRGSETILIAEDEPAVRTLAMRMLSASGYTVLMAGGGEEALQTARAHAGPIHLLLSDVVMPGVSGPALARQFVADRAEAVVLYMSGYTDDAIGHHGVLATGIPFLQKPFTREGLLLRVRETLDRRPRD